MKARRLPSERPRERRRSTYCNGKKISGQNTDITSNSPCLEGGDLKVAFYTYTEHKAVEPVTKGIRIFLQFDVEVGKALARAHSFDKMTRYHWIQMENTSNSTSIGRVQFCLNS